MRRSSAFSATTSAPGELRPGVYGIYGTTRVTIVQDYRQTGALSFPAVQPFVERASASEDDFDLTDSNAPAIAFV